MKTFILLSSATMTALVGVSSAASIVWSAPADATDENVIISPNNIVQAYNVGGGELTVTVGGVDVVFADNTEATGVAANLGSGANSNGNYWQGTVAADADFNTLLDSQRWQSGNAQVIPLSGLTAGVTYSVQLFAIDNRGGGPADRMDIFSDGVNESAQSGRDSGDVGQFVVGTFTADGPTQDITAIGADVLGNGGPQLNAVVIATAIPEPSALTLLGLAGFGLTLRRRRK